MNVEDGHDLDRVEFAALRPDLYALPSSAIPTATSDYVRVRLAAGRTARKARSKVYANRRALGGARFASSWCRRRRRRPRGAGPYALRSAQTGAGGSFGRSPGTQISTGRVVTPGGGRTLRRPRRGRTSTPAPRRTSSTGPTELHACDLHPRSARYCEAVRCVSRGKVSRRRCGRGRARRSCRRRGRRYGWSWTGRVDRGPRTLRRVGRRR